MVRVTLSNLMGSHECTVSAKRRDWDENVVVSATHETFFGARIVSAL